MHCSEAFRANFYFDFKVVTKARTGSSMGHLQWYLPIYVMVDLFHVAQNLWRTPTMVVVSGLDEDLFSNLMDPGWNSKIHYGKDMINCVVAQHTFKFKWRPYISLGCAYLQSIGYNTHCTREPDVGMIGNASIMWGGACYMLIFSMVDFVYWEMALLGSTSTKFIMRLWCRWNRFWRLRDWNYWGGENMANSPYLRVNTHNNGCWHPCWLHIVDLPSWPS